MSNSQKIDGFLYAKMIKSGTANLRAHAKEINDLNVFPIPDGDTGDNMLLTIVGGAQAAGEGSGNLSETAKKVSDGMLLSARGNSGVILSQIFEGISKGLENISDADTDEIISALKEGVKQAYDAVMQPTEGTMLTVVRCATEHVSDENPSNPESLMSSFVDEAKHTLDQTPDMLPVLKKAGVVDSGGAGLLCIFEGMLGALRGEELSNGQAYSENSSENVLDLDKFGEDSVLEFGYCTELLVRLQRAKTDIENFDVSIITDYLSSIGDSVATVKNGSIVKIHVHTMTPDKVLSFCQQYGEFLKIKIENMSLQHNNTDSVEKASVETEESCKKDFAVVAVASGDGVKQLFTEHGCDVIVDGGQSMNPSTEDFLDAFKKANAKTIFVFPNNGNIILSAKQAAGMYTDSDVRVIESHTIGDGYASLTMFSPESGDADTIEAELIDAMSGVVTAEISKSIRDTDEVSAGDYIGFVGKDIIASKPERLDTAKETVDKLGISMYDICIVIYGKNTDEDEAIMLEKHILSTYPGKEVYTISGVQEIYDYIIIME